MRHLIYCLFLCLPLLNYAQNDKNTTTTAIQQVLDDQVLAWNNGDIPAFMEGYWKSGELKFMGTESITYGWQETLDRYKKGYPDDAAMGKLTFTIREITLVHKKVATVLGKFHLQRANDEPSGDFFLVFKKVKGEWLIISDFTVLD